MSEFALTILKAQRGLAVKRRTRSTQGKTIKSDPTLNEALWQIRRHSIEADVDKITLFQRAMANARIYACPWGSRARTRTHGTGIVALAPKSTDPIALSSMRRASTSPSISTARCAARQRLDKGENLYALADYAREELLPPALRQIDLAIAASSSTGLKPGFGSLHAYALLDHATPLPTIYKWLDGAKKAGFSLDPRPGALRPVILAGPSHVLGARRPRARNDARICAAWPTPDRDVAWNEFSAVLKAYERHERQAHAEGATGGWRSVMTRRLGDGEGKLGFFKTTSIALGYAARSGEPADEVAAEMHAIIAAHPDLTADREGQYTMTWLVRELLRLRAKDHARRLNAEHTLINRAQSLLRPIKTESTPPPSTD